MKHTPFSAANVSKVIACLLCFLGLAGGLLCGEKKDTVGNVRAMESGHCGTIPALTYLTHRPSSAPTSKSGAVFLFPLSINFRLCFLHETEPF
jgi:hypothetical protein